MAPRKRRPGAVDALSSEERAVLDELLSRGGVTLREITDKLQDMGAEISKSSVHRYSQHVEEIASDIRATRQMAEAIGRELTDTTGDDGRLVIESMHALLLRLRKQIADKDEIAPKEIQILARAVKDVQHALKLNVETEIKIRDRALSEAAEAVDEVAKHEGGLTRETVNAIKSRILGLKQQS